MKPEMSPELWEAWESTAPRKVPAARADDPVIINNLAKKG
jgi:hypothetical protein